MRFVTLGINCRITGGKLFQMGKISEDLLTHVLTVLNIYTQLQETPANTKPHGRILHLLPSKKGEREEISYRVQPHYLKLHQILRHGHSNYKVRFKKSLALLA